MAEPGHRCLPTGVLLVPRVSVSGWGQGGNNGGMVEKENGNKTVGH